MRLMCGLMDPQKVAASVAGMMERRNSTEKDQIGYMAQRVGWDGDLDGRREHGVATRELFGSWGRNARDRVIGCADDAHGAVTKSGRRRSFRAG